MATTMTPADQAEYTIVEALRAVRIADQAVDYLPADQQFDAACALLAAREDLERALQALTPTEEQARAVGA